MAFTVEDGSIVLGANSYVSLDYANVYFADRGSPSDWVDAYVDAQEAALIYATAWLDYTFSWYSIIQDTDQVLGWPRTSYYDKEGRTIGGSGVIPTQVKNATCEMALQYLSEDFTSPDNEGVRSESIGASSITYSKSYKNFTHVKMALKEFGTNTSNIATIYRA